MLVIFDRLSAVKGNETGCVVTRYSPLSPLRDFPADFGSMENQTLNRKARSSLGHYFPLHQLFFFSLNFVEVVNIKQKFNI